MDAKEAKQILLKEEQEKVQRCVDKIQAILNEEKCKFMVSVLITERGNIPQVQIVPTGEVDNDDTN